MSLPMAMGLQEVSCFACQDFGPGVILAAHPYEENPALLGLCDDCLRGALRAVEQRLKHEAILRQSQQPDPTPAPPAKANYYGPNWDVIRARIIARDGNACRDDDHIAAGGSKSDDRLVVHHIKPLREFGGDYDTANQEHNLITLCTLCHGRWHSRLYHEAKAARQQQ